VTQPTNHRSFVWQEKFEEANGLIRSVKNTTQKTKDRATRTPLKTGDIIFEIATRPSY